MLLSRNSPLLAHPCDHQWCVRTIGHILDPSTRRVHGTSSWPPNNVSEPSDLFPDPSSGRGPTFHDVSFCRDASLRPCVHPAMVPSPITCHRNRRVHPVCLKTCPHP